MNRKIRMGMVGGGVGAFIGAIHRHAANLDGQIELVCGAFSSDPEKSRITGEGLFLPADRIYPDYETMIKSEAKLPEGERMDFISIVTPNHVHFGPAEAALKHGFHVMIDKPLALTREEGVKLQELVEHSGLLFGITYTYTGYPMVKHARHLVRNGAIGKIRKVYVEYPQGWLAANDVDTKQSAWRTDINRSGISGCMGDIGTHAANIAEYITGLEIMELCSQLNIIVDGREIDDDGSVFLKFDGGVTGTLMASQVATGEENNLKVRIFGDKAGITWMHRDPNSLSMMWLDRPVETLRTGAGLSDVVDKNIRTPAGHPEGYIEAFANHYKNFIHQIRCRMDDSEPDPDLLDVPDIDEGMRGMMFIEKVVESSANGSVWVKLK